MMSNSTNRARTEYGALYRQDIFVKDDAQPAKPVLQMHLSGGGIASSKDLVCNGMPPGSDRSDGSLHGSPGFDGSSPRGSPGFDYGLADSDAAVLSRRLRGVPETVVPSNTLTSQYSLRPSPMGQCPVQPVNYAAAAASSPRRTLSSDVREESLRFSPRLKDKKTAAGGVAAATDLAAAVAKAVADDNTAWSARKKSLRSNAKGAAVVAAEVSEAVEGESTGAKPPTSALFSSRLPAPYSVLNPNPHSPFSSSGPRAPLTEPRAGGTTQMPAASPKPAAGRTNSHVRFGVHGTPTVVRQATAEAVEAFGADDEGDARQAKREKRLQERQLKRSTKDAATAAAAAEAAEAAQASEVARAAKVARDAEAVRADRDAKRAAKAAKAAAAAEAAKAEKDAEAAEAAEVAEAAEASKAVKDEGVTTACTMAVLEVQDGDKKPWLPVASLIEGTQLTLGREHFPSKTKRLSHRLLEVSLVGGIVKMKSCRNNEECADKGPRFIDSHGALMKLKPGTAYSARNGTIIRTNGGSSGKTHLVRVVMGPSTTWHTTITDMMKRLPDEPGASREQANELLANAWCQMPMPANLVPDALTESVSPFLDQLKVPPPLGSPFALELGCKMKLQMTCGNWNGVDSQESTMLHGIEGTVAGFHRWCYYPSTTTTPPVLEPKWTLHVAESYFPFLRAFHTGDPNESSTMETAEALHVPHRYLVPTDGNPIQPSVLLERWKRVANKSAVPIVASPDERQSPGAHPDGDHRGCGSNDRRSDDGGSDNGGSDNGRSGGGGGGSGSGGGGGGDSGGGRGGDDGSSCNGGGVRKKRTIIMSDDEGQWDDDDHGGLGFEIVGGLGDVNAQEEEDEDDDDGEEEIDDDDDRISDDGSNDDGGTDECDDDDEEDNSDDSGSDSDAFADRRDRYQQKRKAIKAKTSRAAKRQARVHNAVQRHNLLPRGPRTLEALKALDLDGILCVGSTFSTKGEVKLALSEYCEVQGKRWTASQTKSRRLGGERCRDEASLLVARCGLDPLGCAFHCRVPVSKHNATVKELTPHTSCEAAVHTPRVVASAYTAQQLAPLLTTPLINDPKMKAADARSTLQSYVKLALANGNKPLSKLPDHAMAMARNGSATGNSVENTKRLSALVALLNKQGHKTKLLYMSGAELRPRMHAVMQADLKLRNKDRKDGAQVEEFDVEKANAELGLKDDEQYLYGWMWAPKTSVEQHNRDTLLPIAQADFAFMKGKTRGQLAVMTAQDAGHHLVPLVYMQVLDAETKPTWELMVKYAKEVYVNFDATKRRVIADQDKGGESVLKAQLVQGNHFWCEKHRREHVPASSRDAYKAMVFASTHARLQQLKSALPSGAREKLAKVNDEHQYLVAAGEMHGQYTSNSAESLNKANLRVRQGDCYESLKMLVEDSCRRFKENKVAAHKKGLLEPPHWSPAVASGSVKNPPTGWGMDANELQATRYQHVTFLDAAKRTARVRSASQIGMEYNTDLDAHDCDCGRPNVFGLPCGHMVAHCEKAGIQVQTIMHPKHTRRGWEMQYPAALTFPIPPSAAKIEQEVVMNPSPELLLPPLVARGKGRPKKNRQKRPMEEATLGKRKRTTKTCSNCWRTGHSKNHCRNPPRDKP